MIICYLLHSIPFVFSCHPGFDHVGEMAMFKERILLLPYGQNPHTEQSKLVQTGEWGGVDKSSQLKNEKRKILFQLQAHPVTKLSQPNRPC